MYICFKSDSIYTVQPSKWSDWNQYLSKKAIFMAVVVVYERCLSYKFHFNISPWECDVSWLLGLMRCHSVSPVSTALTVAWIQARRFLFYSTICRTRRSAPLLNGARDCNLLPVGMLCISSKSILGASASRVLMAYIAASARFPWGRVDLACFSLCALMMDVCDTMVIPGFTESSVPTGGTILSDQFVDCRVSFAARRDDASVTWF